MAELLVEDIRLRLGDSEILKGVSLALPKGQVMALLGPSGSGKTTLLRAVAGLEQPSAGRIVVSGRTVYDAGTHLPAEKRGLGLVFQSYALWPHRTVFANVAYGLRLRGVPRAEIEARVAEVLESLGLGRLGERYPHQLSGGQQQRVALARALVYRPSVILLDEPLSNLDAKLRDEARAWLRSLILHQELSALIVTHDQVEALALADRVTLLAEGRIEQEGTPQELYDAPRTLFAAEFMGQNNRIPGRVVERRDGVAVLEVGAARLLGQARGAQAPGEPATGLIRLEAVRVTAEPGPNRISLPLDTTMFLGERWEYVFRAGELTLRAHGNTDLARGEHWLELPAEKLWIF